MEKIDLGGTEIIDWTQTIVWEDESRHLDGVCPACSDAAAKPVRLSVRSPWPPHPHQPLVVCRACGTAFHPTMAQPPYEAVLDPLVDVYLEQNAGIDVMAAVLAAVDPARVRRYMEIGCGFGFLLDYARVVHGWEAKGFDPGFSARAGREVLGVDIEHVYLNTPADAGPHPFDAVLCSEVIEHVFEPDTLLAILRDVLAPGGTLLLTTPSAGGIRPDIQPGTLLSLLCPGYHYVLFSARGMEILLRRVGFGGVAVQDTGHTLRVAASVGPLTADLDRPFDRSHYARYLRTRAGTTEAGTPLGIGYRYRLLKEMTNAGDYPAARAAAEAVAEACSTGWSLDVTDPAALLARLKEAPLPASIEEHHKSWPFCLGGILYFNGMIAWQGDQDRERAHLWFAAAALAGERMRKTLHIIGADDGETEELTWRARGYAAHVLAWTRPDAAADAVERLGLDASPLLGERMPAGYRVPMQTQIFVDLVNLGQYAAADRLAPLMEETLPEDGAPLAGACFALGILNLNHRKAPRTAVRWFEQAHGICRRLADTGNAAAAEPLLWSSLFHQAQALADSDRKDAAAEALRGLLHPPAGLPEVPSALRTRALALATACRLRF